MGISWACLLLHSVCHAKGSGCHAKGSGRLPWWSQQWAAGAPSNPTASACIPECYLCTYFSPLTVLAVWAVQQSWFAWVNALGLHEWMPFVIFFARSHERSQLPLPGRFLSMCWFMLCITVEVQPRIVKQCKCRHCCVCKNYRGKAMEDGKKVP